MASVSSVEFFLHSKKANQKKIIHRKEIPRELNICFICVIYGQNNSVCSVNFIAKGSKTFSSVRNESYVELTLNNIFTSKIHTHSVYSSFLTFSNPQATFKQENSHFSENKRNLFILLSVRLFTTKRE